MFLMEHKMEIKNMEMEIEKPGLNYSDIGISNLSTEFVSLIQIPDKILGLNSRS